jgi:hypothetical protein
MRNSSLLAMEIIWIAAGAMCIYAAVRSAITGDIGRMIIFILMTVISFIFGMLRHNQRKKS